MKYDKEYRTQYLPEVDFLKSKGIYTTFVKKPPSERTVAFFAIYDNKDLILRISSSTKASLLSQEHQ